MFKKTKSWYSGQSTIGKGIVLGIAAVFAMTAVSVANSSPSKPESTPVVQEESNELVVETKIITETEEIAFSKTTVNDANIEKGQSSIRTTGVNGVKTFTYEITYEDGQEKDKKLIKEEATTAPVTQVTAIGTKVPYVAPPPVSRSSNCDPNYSGCVPIASDVDCAGGSGNGPAYVSGPVTVTGSDIYDLDRDSDGLACE
ncbi:MAG TPA: G5 domain-containing protein [Patescibacteria group bacterium]|nr:G5 domain-containing protein [Patescibacteria group bacterium]